MKKTFLGFILFLFVSAAFASAGFVIKNIQIRGLQGISRSTVGSYVPIKVGDRMDESKNAEIIKSLFSSGFFDNVSLSRSNDTLIINVQQRPIISKIKITGNKLIPTDRLNVVLRQLGFTEGSIFNLELLNKIKSSLQHEYFMVGKYNASVNTSIKKLARNRVEVDVKISEGKTAKIRSVSIVGNQVFSEKTLLRQFKLTPSGLFTLFSKNDQYSPDKLSADLQSLLSFYMDRGYIRFKVLSSQVSITPDRKAVYIAVHILEGAQYKISGYDFSGQLILPKDQLMKMVTFKKGNIFSRTKLMATNKRIASALGEKGYANADIDAIPKIDDKTNTVVLNFIIKPGPRIYVHRIRFSGNYRTNDVAYRRELIQLEGSLLSPENLQESKRKLLNLPYVQDVKVATNPTPGKKNQVDITYNIKEMAAAELQGGVGYSQLDKFSVNGAFNQKNILGTGNTLGLNVYYSQPQTRMGFTYFNPYYTQSHIGRSIDLYASHFDASNANLTSYATDTYSFGNTYYFPIAPNDNLSAGFGIENNLVNIGSTPSKELLRFKDKFGRRFYYLKANAGWSHQSFDRYLFPTRGLMASANISGSVPLSKTRSLEYYKTDASALYYHPIYKDFTAQLRGHVGYGNGYGRFGGKLPFFKNYFAGGVGSVRGFEGNTLGPQDSNGDSLGGNYEMDGTIGLVFPNPFHQKVRTTLFVDAGNVYDGFNFNNFSKLKYSTGLEVDWKSPMGVLNFSLAKPLNAKSGDETEFFQFTIGTTF